jgi:Fe-S oxidoreductase/nitrate reductase gamma subunit
MLPLPQKILFLVFAAITLAAGARGFQRLFRRIARGREDTDPRFDHLPRRIWQALITTLTQGRTFRKRPWVSLFHSFIFYGFVFYLLVNLTDAIEGFVPVRSASLGVAGNLYVLLADVLSFLVLIGVVALLLRRFLLPSRRDFTFNDRTLLHPDVKRQRIAVDSAVVSVFILFHVGSRAVGAGARIAMEGPDSFAPFATLISHLFTPQNAMAWRIFGYWGALGSVLAFLSYFPFSKHLHIFMAPAKYLVARPTPSGVLPAVALDLETETPQLGAKRLEDLAWPRLLDAYACIQCNRCQDVCPATATGKSLSPSALEINKRMELNSLARHSRDFELGAASPQPLLAFALSPEAAWACTTCGACIDVCPVGDEPMLDIIDIRRQQVMIEGDFPAQLQTAFRGMERAKNPWGINHEKRLDWAQGLNVKTTDQNPSPDVLFWVGCAASYDPQSQKTARAFVQLLDHAGVDFAVLGKRECCTGDTARRSGNEYLYRQLADTNVATLNEIKPKLIVATCPHCMNSLGKEYRQIGGEFKVIHHTEYLETLVAEGKLDAGKSASTVAYHDPCYLGRHNGVYDAPRNLLKVLSNTVVELPRNRENSFCCGAGGGQFWKEEEAGSERISDNRYREAQRQLAGTGDKVLAVGCPFCKSMLESTPGKGAEPIAVRDVAELLLEGVQRRSGKPSAAAIERVSEASPTPPAPRTPEAEAQPAREIPAPGPVPAPAPAPATAPATAPAPVEAEAHAEAAVKPETRKKWAPKSASPKPPVDTPAADPAPPPSPPAPAPPEPPKRKAWKPKQNTPQE